MTAPQTAVRRGWVAFGAGIFLIVFMSAIWIWVDRLLAPQAGEASVARMLGHLNLAFGLIVLSGILGTINGWQMAHSGKRNILLLLVMLVIFGAALFIAAGAST